MKRPQHILLNVSYVYTSVFIFSPPSKTRGSGEGYLFLPCSACKPLRWVLHEQGWRVAPHLCSPAELAPFAMMEGTSRAGMAKCRVSTWLGVSRWPLPNGDGTRTAQSCPTVRLFPHRRVSEATQKVPMSHSLPAAQAPLVLW